MPRSIPTAGALAIFAFSLKIQMKLASLQEEKNIENTVKLNYCQISLEQMWTQSTTHLFSLFACKGSLRRTVKKFSAWRFATWVKSPHLCLGIYYIPRGRFWNVLFIQALISTNQKRVSIGLRLLLDTRHKLRTSMVVFHTVIDRLENSLRRQSI